MERQNARSILWPIILIVVGVIWLLGNLNIAVPEFDFSLLFELWPLILIVVGLNLLIGKRRTALRAAVVLLAIAGAIAYVYLAPIYGLVSRPEIKHIEFSEPLGEAGSAVVSLDVSVGSVRLEALEDSDNLFEASLDYVGEVVFEAEGEAEKIIRLSGEADEINSDLFEAFDEEQLTWMIGISPEVPVTLDFSGGVGSMELDMSGLNLGGVVIDSGVGTTDLTLPSQDDPYFVQISGGVGELRVSISEGADIDLRVDGGVGQIVIDTPEEAGVRVNANLGVGNVKVPGDFILTRGGSQVIGSSGSWVSPNFESADHRIEINYDGGVGNLLIE